MPGRSPAKLVVSHHHSGIPPGRRYPVVLRGNAAQDVVIELVIRRASPRGSELDPETIGRERTVIVLFREVVHQLHRRPGGVHRKSVAGEKQEMGGVLRKSRTAVGKSLLESSLEYRGGKNAV